GGSRRGWRGVLAPGGVIDLVLQVQMLIRREDVRDIGNELHLVAYQRIDAGLFGGGRDAQAAQHHGAHFHGRFAQVRDAHIGLKRAHAPSLIFADYEFQVVAAGSQEEAGVVLHVFSADLAGAFHREFYGVAQAADGEFAALESFPDDVNGGVVLVLFGNERNLRAGDDEGNGEIVVGIVLAEIGGAGVERHIHAGQLGGQLVFELLFAVGAVQVLEVAPGVIAGAEIKLQVRPLHGDLQVAEPAVFRRIVAGESQNVIDGTVFLHLGEDAAEIIGIEEGFAAGVRGKRGEGVLGSGVAVQVVENRGAGVGGMPVQAGVLRFATRRKGLQAADVQGIDGGVGLHGGGRGGAQGRLVIHAGLRDAIAEINDALFLWELAERLHQGLN